MWLFCVPASQGAQRSDGGDGGGGDQGDLGDLGRQGDTDGYGHWPRWIGSAEVCPLRPPNLGAGIGAGQGLHELPAERLADGLMTALDRPFAFFGHGGGALLGVDVVRCLERRGLPGPVRLFISAQTPPHGGAVQRGAGAVYRLPAPVGLSCPITVIGWADDADHPPELMAGWWDYADDVRFAMLDGDPQRCRQAPAGLQTLIAYDLERTSAARASSPGGAA
jgi:surfactin synthase thioesterase subunit